MRALVLTLTLSCSLGLCWSLAPAAAQEAGLELPDAGPAALERLEAELKALGELRAQKDRDAAKAKRSALRDYTGAFLSRFPGQVADAELERVLRIHLGFGGDFAQALAALRGAAGTSAAFKEGLAALEAFQPVRDKISQIFRLRRQRKPAAEVDAVRDEVYALLGPWLDANATRSFGEELERGLREWMYQAKRKGDQAALDARLAALRERSAELPASVQGLLIEHFLRPGQPAPAWSAKTLAGDREVSLESLRGKVVLIDFWASWCRPCLSLQKKRLLPLQERYGARADFAIVGLGLGQVGRNADTAAQQAAAAEKLGAHWLKVFDPSGAAAKAYGIGGAVPLPYVVLVDGEGKILVKGGGFKVMRAVEAELAKRFGGAEPKQSEAGDADEEGESE